MSTEVPSASPKPLLKLCSKCKHVRKRAAPVLFSPGEAHATGVLKAQVAWDQERKQRAQLELQRLLSRQPFEYEPFSYEWCACKKATKIDDVEQARKGDTGLLEHLLAEGKAQVNPVTGEISALYFLCAWRNGNNECEDFEPR